MELDLLKQRYWGIVLFAVLLCSCVPQKNIQSSYHSVDIPEKWKGPGNYTSDNNSIDWIADFNDPLLSKLITEAFSHNYKLKIAALQLEIVRADSRLANAPLWPSIQLGVQKRRGESKLSELDTLKTINSKSIDVQLGTSWEIDLWGRLRDRAAAGRKDVIAEEAELQAAKLSLTGQVAKIWYQINAENLQLKLLKSTLENYRTATNLVRSRYENGIAEPLDLRLLLSNIATTEDLLYAGKNRLSNAKKNLQLLLQQYPDGNVVELESLPVLKMGVPVGLPSQIIERRPDINVARERLAAADLRIVEAQKEFLPKFTLTGEMGTSSKTLQDILDIDHSFWNILAGLTQPIFQGGRLHAQFDLAQINAERALLVYGQTVFNAFYEVEQALTADHFLALRNTAVENSVEQAVAAECLAVDQYSAGLVDIITVLEAQRRVLNAKLDIIDIQKRRLNNRVDLYLALGGSFEAQ